MLAIAGITTWLLHSFHLEPVGTRLPSSMKWVLLWLARNTLPLYGLHLMALMVLEYKMFPWRL